MSARNTASEIADFYVYALKDIAGAIVKVGQTKDVKLRKRQNKVRGYADCSFHVLESLPDSPRWFARKVERTYQKMFGVLDSTESKEVRKKLSENIKASWDREKQLGINRFENSTAEKRIGLSGLSNPRSKPANIYNAETGCLIADNVSLREWCRENGYAQSRLSMTARGETKHHRGLRAEYINQA
jgi:hypothetical protein